MRGLFRVLSLAALSIVASPRAALARGWTITDKPSPIEATLLNQRDKVVTLVKPHGKLLSVPVSDLNEADRRHLESVRPARAAAHTSNASSPLTANAEDGGLFLQYRVPRLKPLLRGEWPAFVLSITKPDGPAISEVVDARQMPSGQRPLDYTVLIGKRRFVFSQVSLDGSTLGAYRIICHYRGAERSRVGPYSRFRSNTSDERGSLTNVNLAPSREGPEASTPQDSWAGTQAQRSHCRLQDREGRPGIHTVADGAGRHPGQGVGKRLRTT